MEFPRSYESGDGWQQADTRDSAAFRETEGWSARNVSVGLKGEGGAKRRKRWVKKATRNRKIPRTDKGFAEASYPAEGRRGIPGKQNEERHHEATVRNRKTAASHADEDAGRNAEVGNSGPSNAFRYPRM